MELQFEPHVHELLVAHSRGPVAPGVAPVLLEPRIHGKGLSTNRSGEWRYRIGNYRALCIIEDDRLIIEVFSVGHRRHIYQ